MSVRLRRRVALLAVLTYALAGTLGDLWHTHDGPLVEQHQWPVVPDWAVADGAVADGFGRDHGHAPTSPVAESNGGGGGHSDHDDSCAVCRFVAKSSLAGSPVAESGPGELTGDLAVVASVRFSSSVPSDCLARAPPAAGSPSNCDSVL